MSIDPWGVAMVAAAGYVASVIGGISAFGAGLMVTPFLLPVVGIKAVVPVITFAMILGNLSRLWVNRDAVQPQFLLRLSIAMLPGVVLGTMIYNALSPKALAIVIGGFMIFSVALRRVFKRWQPKPTPRGALVVGFGFGVLTGSSPGAGIIMVAILLALGLSGPALIATDAVIGALINITKTLMFGTLDLLDLETAAVGLIIGIAMIPGAYTARWLTDRMGARLHVAFIEAFVILGGGYFIYQAFSQ